MKELHKLLLRQLRREGIDHPENLPGDKDVWAGILLRISDSYFEFDKTRYLMERSAELASRETDVLYRHLEEHREKIESIMSDGLCFINENFQVESVNLKAEKLLGANKRAIIGSELTDVFKIYLDAKHDKAISKAQLFQKIKSGKAFHEPLVYIGDRKGEMVTADLAINPIMHHEAFIGASIVFRDISARIKIEKELQEREQLFRGFAENIESVFWIYDKTGLKPVYVSPAFETVFGRSLAALDKNPGGWGGSIHSEDAGRVKKNYAAHAARGTYDEQFRIVLPDKSERWIWDRCFLIKNEKDEVLYVAGVAEDITERKLFETQLEQLALYDQLTGLANRSLCHEILKESITQTRRHNKTVGVLFIDVDYFKRVNDSKGHHVGDLLLQEIAIRLKNEIRASDTAGRMGGDEFVVILKQMDERQDAEEIAKKILAKMKDPIVISGQELNVDVSIGIAVYPGDGVNDEELLQNADKAMYEVKARRSADYQVYINNKK